MNKKIVKAICKMGLIVFIFPSCTHYYYGPNSNNIPVFEKKGEGRVNGSLSSTFHTTGYELQSAYAISNHFGAMINLYGVGANTYSTRTNAMGNTETETGNAGYVEIGGGYFTNLNDKKNKIIFETYAGVGTGYVNNFYFYSAMSNIRVNRFFLQPSIGFTNEKGNFVFAFATRVSFVNLRVNHENLTNQNNYNDFADVRDIKSNGKNIFLEPSALMRIGNKKLKLLIQTTGSNPLQKKIYRTQSGIFSWGLCYSF